MLTIDDIKALARQHALEVTTSWSQATTRGDDMPRPKRLTVHFDQDAPEAWRSLMSEPTEIDVSVYGTRQVTGSGATDGLLKPVYAALLPEVNTRRAAVGLDPILN